MMPKLITDRDDFMLEKFSDNLESTQSFLARQPETLVIDKWNLLKAGNTIRLIEEGETLYHVKFEIKTKKFWNSPSQAIQVEVWRQVGSGEITHGLPKAIFFDYFLDRYGTIVCDYLHTEHGKRFWLDRLTEALKANYEVFYGDYGTRGLTKINNKRELMDSYVDQCWGTNTKHEYRRMAIISKSYLCACSQCH
ncbi:MAG: hypothetical protein KAI83_06175 [Thiomargarita sp.]|nr:hypothetical protein [Thiomargarita sp.]